MNKVGMKNNKNKWLAVRETEGTISKEFYERHPTGSW